MRSRPLRYDRGRTILMGFGDEQKASLHCAKQDEQQERQDEGEFNKRLTCFSSFGYQCCAAIGTRG